MSQWRARSYEQEQKKFQDFFATRHLDSKPFLAAVRNSVGKQELYRSRPKLESKSVAGALLGYTAASFDTRLNLARAAANEAIRNVDSVLAVNDLRLSWDDLSITNWAEAKASRCAQLIDKEFGLLEIERLVESYGFKMPRYDQKDFFFGDHADAQRCCDMKWWRRQVRVAKVRAIDQVARSFRMVHAKAQVYCSNEAVRLRRQQVKRNRSTLEGFEAINQEGQSYTLAELSDLSASNPVIRRNELMVRMRGFEEMAEQFGHEGLFITMSAPSRFHPMRQIKSKNGRLLRVEENPKYEGATPRDAQEWLNKTWQLTRAELLRQGIRCYGFRVVEPHADGCPHWHQLLFFAAEDIKSVENIFSEYSMRTDSEEAGAKKYRLKIVAIDRSKGSAAGYIAKYISKSIDGTHIDDDLLGNSGANAAERICAWASTWGIRQFQQIGGASVTVWRELRRLDAAEGITELARDAADSADWAAYCLLQGNGFPFIVRKEQPIRAAYWLEHNANTGEEIDAPCNKYGEKSTGKIFGVESVFEEKFFLTRFFTWTIQRLGAAVKAVKKALPVCVLSADEMLDLLRGDGLGSTA